MKSNVKTWLIVLTSMLLFFLPLVLKAQSPCRESFNYALDRYQKGQFETISVSLNTCVNDILTYKNDYLRNINGRSRTTVLKVYKIIINSLRNVNQDNLADMKMNELVNIFVPMARAAVQAQLNATILQPIE